jgi:NitT/TauT family transport system substrate-binding protein
VALVLGALLATPVLVNAEETSFTIGTSRDLQLGAQIGMAKHKGFFKAEGLDITVAYFGSGAEMTSAMAAGQLPVGSFGDFPTVSMIAADLPIKIVSVQAEISGTQQIVVRDGITGPGDLKGKKLGLMVGSSSESLLRSTLAHYKVPANSVEFINMRPPEQVAALARGDIDGLAVWQPYVLRAKNQAKGHAILSALESFVPGMEGPLDYYAAYSLLVVRNEFSSANPNTVKAILRALYKAQKYVNGNKADTAKTMEADMRVPAKDLRVFLDENVYDMTITAKMLRTLNNTVEFMHQAGKIKSKPKIEAYVDSSFLKSVDPSLVE